jgi:TPR repeat protein
MRQRLAVALVPLAALAIGCKGKSGAPSPEQAAPVSTAIEMLNVIGTCDDLELCVKECDQGQGDRCRRLAATLQFAKPPDRDETKATVFYEKACKLGNAPGCVSAGQMFEYAHGVTKDDAKAAGYYEHACDVGYMVGCANYAIMLENGRGVAKDEEAAARLYDKACQAGAGLACERGRALKRDAAR